MTEYEKQLRQQIADSELDKKAATNRMAAHRQEMLKAESDMISASLSISKLEEELAAHLRKYPPYEETYREKDIREFKERLPELLKKIQ